MNDIHTTFRGQGLVRPRDGRVLGGVVAGLGRRFGISAWPARLLFVLALMVIPGKPDHHLPDPVDPQSERGAHRGPYLPGPRLSRSVPIRQSMGFRAPLRWPEP